MPLSKNCTKAGVDEWIAFTRQRLRSNYSLYTTLYWYLAEYSCVLIERNRLWFEAARPLIEDTWKTILKERETGCEHRASKKRVKTGALSLEVVHGDVTNTSHIIRNLPVTGGVCLIKLE